VPGTAEGSLRRLTVGGVLQGGGNLSGLTLRRLEELGGVAGIVEGAGPLGKVGVVEHLARIRGPPGPDLSHNLTVSEKIVFDTETRG